jgi:D-sedoheptulose 7-phosphate isomerase
MKNNEFIKQYFQWHIDLINNVNVLEISKAIKIIENTFSSEKKIITCGNGGSAMTASHYITDWNKSIGSLNKRFLGFSLVDNVGLITAIANDINYEEIFSTQLHSILEKGDLLILISGSGNSKNLLRAAEYANKNGARTLGIIGYGGGMLKDLCEESIILPSYDMQICEDFHLMFGHLVMRTLGGGCND